MAGSWTHFQSLGGRMLTGRERLERFRQNVGPSNLRMRQLDGFAVRWMPQNARPSSSRGTVRIEFASTIAEIASPTAVSTSDERRALVEPRGGPFTGGRVVPCSWRTTPGV